MICCTPTIVPFNEAVTTVNYTALAALYGQDPNVQVYYKEGANYVLSNDMTSVKFDGVNIIVDHGGPVVGLLKIF